MKFLIKKDVHVYEGEGVGEDGDVQRERKAYSRTIDKPVVRGGEGKK